MKKNTVTINGVSLDPEKLRQNSDVTHQTIRNSIVKKYYKNIKPEYESQY